MLNRVLLENKKTAALVPRLRRQPAGSILEVDGLVPRAADKKKAQAGQLLGLYLGGKGGIRTLDTV
jgi:hypothetical protein